MVVARLPRKHKCTYCSGWLSLIYHQYRNCPIGSRDAARLRSYLTKILLLRLRGCSARCVSAQIVNQPSFATSVLHGSSTSE